ncbi:MAG: beta-Ala-His dipeptidase, partial [Bacteroidaceae bacterium]|nr:beta-Ala-His dipeptidase [Bacteroidaceae bacterium]
MAGALAALIDPEIQAGPLCALCTVDEETGLTGATKISEGMIRADYLLNLDSEEDGEICMGCAGGKDSNATFTYTPTPAPQDFVYFNVAFKKFSGGHSGTDINTERACANKVVSRFLYNWYETCPETALAEIKGGNLRNAIAREANAVIGVPASAKEALSVAINNYEADLRIEYKRTEPTFEVSIESVDTPANVIDADTARRVVYALYSAPHGVTYYSKEIEGLVETSTNLGAIKMPGNNTIVVSTLQRSSVESRKEDIVGQVVAHFKLAGASVYSDEGYQGWAPNMDSHILQVAVDVHEKLFGSKPVVNAIHAGLECGLFLAKYPHLDMISFGPTLRNVHSPQEMMHIPAVAKYWDLIRGIINAVAGK